ncbi:MAG: GntR family transcriptional regulator [Lentisphaeria bacterium]
MTITTKTSRVLCIKGVHPQHEQVRKTLKEHLATLEIGDRLASDRQLSAMFNVDRTTIRRAMSDLAQEGYVQRRQGCGTVVAMTVHLGAPSVSSKLIGMTVPDVEIPSFACLLKGVDEEAQAHGYSVLVRNSNQDTRRERNILEELRHQKLAGIIVNPFHEDAFDRDYHRLLNEIHQGGTRIVMVDQYLPGLEELPTVYTDKVQIGYRATEHLIMLGHRRICYLTTGHYDTTGQGCLKGHRLALNEYGIDYDPALTAEIPNPNCAEPAHDFVLRLLRANPNAFTAVATQQFSMTYGILNALQELSLRVPEEIAVVGGDAFENPRLSHVTHTLQPFQEMGRAAVRLVLGRNGTGGEAAKRHVLLQPRLVIGDTCGMRPARRPATSDDSALPVAGRPAETAAENRPPGKKR